MEKIKRAAKPDADLTALCARLHLDPTATGLQVVDAREVGNEHFPRLDTDRPALVLGLASATLARQVQRTLRVNYPAAHPITLVKARGQLVCSLAALGRAKDFTRRTALLVPPLPLPSSPQALAGLVARLRAPRGCPWDREQTHASLRRALIEEAYEVIEAIDENDSAQLREEIGDLFLHVLFQTQIAREANEFSFAEVCTELAAKLIRRHPHVFGEVQVAGADEVIANWERIKQQEKLDKGRATHTALDAGIPRDLPALTRAQKVHERLAKQGDSTPQSEQPAWAQAVMRARDRERALGDLLWQAASLAQELGLDAESALRQATRRRAEGVERK